MNDNYLLKTFKDLKRKSYTECMVVRTSAVTLPAVFFSPFVYKMRDIRAPLVGNCFK